ncbi:MAG: hypothetical protein JWO38_4575 [Gemmataceae bacterium]|nr:hypothetical protein [Gemmataceae bacterium]
MLGWLLPPKCPLGTRDKAWVERRMLWLAGAFGIDRMRTAPVVLPTDEFFPDRYDADLPSARRCLDRVCGYMGIDPARIALEILPDESMPGAAGLYEIRGQSKIYVAQSQLAAPLRLIAVLSHELAHELLLKGRHLSTEVDDHEQITDLLPVFLGVGIFLANATIHTSAWSTGNMSYWSISRSGYLSSITLGYALALFAFVRGESRPRWANHLRTDAAVTLRAGLRYLRKTGDSLFRPDTVTGPRPAPTPAKVIEQLDHPSPSFRLCALWDVTGYALPPTELLPAVGQCLDDSDPDVQCEAVKTLGAFGAAAREKVPRLIQAAWCYTPAVRVAAIGSLGEIGTDPANVVPELSSMLRDKQADVVRAAADALAAYERQAGSAEPQLLAALEAAAKVTDIRTATRLVAALLAVSRDAKRRVREYFSRHDPEVYRLAVGMVEDEGG